MQKLKVSIILGLGPARLLSVSMTTKCCGTLQHIHINTYGYRVGGGIVPVRFTVRDACNLHRCSGHNEGFLGINGTYKLFSPPRVYNLKTATGECDQYRYNYLSSV
jgi:hypothetical protein